VWLICYLLLPYPVTFDYPAPNRSLLLPSPLTVSSFHSSCSDSDVQISKRISWPFIWSCIVPWCSDVTSRRPNIWLIGHSVRLMGGVGPSLRECNVMFYDARHDHWACSWWRTLLLFTKLYDLTHWDDNKLHQNSSSVQLTTNTCESFHSHLSKYFHHPHPDISLFIMKLGIPKYVLLEATKL